MSSAQDVDGGAPHADDVIDELDRLRAENEALRLRMTRRAGLRRWLAVALVVLTALSGVIAIVAVWAHQTVFETDAFMAAVEPALDDPAVTESISAYAAEEAISALDIETRVTDALTRLDESLSQRVADALDLGDRAQVVIDRLDRPTLAALAPPITTALENRVTQVVDAVVTSERFSSRFPEIVRAAHEAAIDLVRGGLEERPNVSVVDGQVRLNLVPIMAEILRDAAEALRGFGPDITVPAVISDRVDEGRDQLAGAVGARLPDDFGQVVIMSADRLTEVQDAARRLDRLVWLIVLATLVLALVAVAVSPNRRRTTIQLCIGIVAALAIGTVLLRRLDEAIIDGIADPTQAGAVRPLLTEVLSGLRSGVAVVAAIAVAIGISAYLAGRPAWLVRLLTRGPGGSELDLRIARHHDVLRIAGAGVALGVVFLTGIELVPVVIVAGALALYLWVISEAAARVGFIGTGDHGDGVQAAQLENPHTAGVSPSDP